MNHKKKGTLSLIICLLFSVCLLYGCGQSTSNSFDSKFSSEEDPETSVSQELEETDKKIKIGIALYSLQNEYTMRFADAAQSYADEKGMEVLLYDGEYNSDTQVNQIKEMIAANVDGILILPQNAERSVTCVELSAEAGIPIIAVNTKVDSEDLISYVGSPDIKAGEMLMEMMAEYLDEHGKIVILEGPIGQSAQAERLQGIQNILAKYPDIQVISSKTARWSRLEAETVVSSWLDLFDSIDGIIAENDDMALGAIDALEERGISVPVVGVNGSEEAVAAVRDGRMVMTVYQDATKQVNTALDVLLKAIAGEEIEKEYMIPLKEITSDSFQSE